MTCPDRPTYEPAVVEAERVVWLRAVYWEIRAHLESSRPVAAWRRRVPRALAAEALLMTVDPTDAGFQVSQVAARLGLSLDRARALCRWGRRVGLLEEGESAWRLGREGRKLLGELEAAHAEALRSLGRGQDPALWSDLFRQLRGRSAGKGSLDVQSAGAPGSVPG